MKKKTWRCFHCDDVFTDWESAKLHFGYSEEQTAGCKIDLKEYRRAEAENRSYREEDSILHREISNLKCNHQIALRREEEKGYARGLRDGMEMNRTHPICG